MRDATTVSSSIRRGLIRGLITGGLLSLWVTFIFLRQGERPFEEVGTTYQAAVALYVLLGAIAGVIIGALLPFAKSTVGAYAVGLAAGVALAFGITLGAYGAPSRWQDEAYGFVVVIALVATIVVGNEVNKRRLG
jgi:hypothetical protein